jgi:hypothetical protein
MQRLSQRDYRWNGTRFGVPGSTLTIGAWGCTITSLANHSANFTPVDIARFCDFVPDANLVWASISKIPGFTYTHRQWDGNVAAIKQRLNNGEKGLIEIRTNVGRIMHWLAVISHTEGGFLCVDPENPSIDTIIPNNQVTGGCFFRVSVKQPNNTNHMNMPDTTYNELVKLQNKNTADIVRGAFNANNALLLDHYMDRERELRKLKDTRNSLELKLSAAETDAKKQKEAKDTFEVKIAELKEEMKKQTTEITNKQTEIDELKEELKKQTNEKTDNSLPMYKRAFFDTFREGSFALAGWLVAIGGWDLIQEFIADGDFSAGAFNRVAAGLVAAIFGYIQSVQKAERKNKENN